MLSIAQSSGFQRNHRLRNHIVFGFVICFLLLGATGFSGWTANRRAAAAPPSGKVIVVLKNGHQITTSSSISKAKKAGVKPTHVYSTVINGYSASVTPDQAQELANDPNVAAIVPDLPVHAAAQTVPNNIKRVGATQNSTAKIDGVDKRVNADIAIIDTGVDTSQPDLNVVGGTDCVLGNADPNATFDDVQGHGTHVAGTAAAIDNASTIVGVAPGARIWSVRVLDSSASGSESDVICGLDWVAVHANTIDVVNMSLEGPGTDNKCGQGDPLHDAVCDVVNAGVPIVVAAGNEGDDIEHATFVLRDRVVVAPVIPAIYSEVITVSAFTDTDGIGGGSGPSCDGNRDDEFASYSNYGAGVDIAAPGTCVLSTWGFGGTNTLSGTSMATPHVTGAIALYKAANPSASVASVRNWLLTIATSSQAGGHGFTGDPDGTHEPVLWLGPAGNPRAILSPTRGTVNKYITATVIDFPPHANVWLRWDGTLLGKFPIDGSGGATFTFRVPAAPLGKHVVRMA
ncbi:MAG: S8 family serine peptidase, partial [Thermomicrobiales bacterium]